MTDKDIIKALEICRNENGMCSDCPYSDDYTNCNTRIAKDVLDLINRQKAEIEKLKALAENGASAIDTNNRLVQKFAEIKTEAIKEFGKRLKSRINDSVFNYWNNNTGGYYLAEDVPAEIDNLIDEMVGDNNE